MAAEAPSACKFCACTERRACRLIEVQISPDLDPLILPPGRTDILVTAPAFCRIVPCQWIWSLAWTAAEKAVMRQAIPM
jgi:hypothetical protein